jgi:hypothetical protein
MDVNVWALNIGTNLLLGPGTICGNAITPHILILLNSKKMKHIYSDKEP